MPVAPNKRDAYLKRTYGIGLKQYESLLKEQGDKCAVCRKHRSKEKANFHVDHDHSTGEIRGILCSNCNHRVVGRHRLPDLLMAAGKYLMGPFTGFFVPVKKRRKRR